MGSLEGIEIQAATIQVSVERKIPYFAFFGSCFQFPVFLFDNQGWKTKGDERLKRGKARENHLEGLNSFLLCTGYALPITWVGTRLVTPTQHWRGSTSLLHEPSPPLTFPKLTGFGVKGCVCIYVQYINVIALYKAGNICVRYMKPQHDSNIPRPALHAWQPATSADIFVFIIFVTGAVSLVHVVDDQKFYVNKMSLK